MPYNYTHDIPKITGPFEEYPSSITRVEIDETVIDEDGSEFIRSHYWRRIFTTTIRCGETGAFTITAKTGTSQATLSELASSIESSVYVLKAKIASKLSVTETLTEENTVQFVRNVAPKRCYVKRFAEWQRKERITIRKPRGFFRKGYSEHHIDIGTTETYPDEYEYRDPECCEADFDNDVAKGFDQVIAVSYGSYSIALLAKVASGGKVQFPKIAGSFTPGEQVNLEKFRTYLNPSFEIPPNTTGILSQSLGPASAYFGSVEPKVISSTSSVLPLLFGIACTSLVALLFREKLAGAAEEFSDYIDRNAGFVSEGDPVAGREFVGKGRDVSGLVGGRAKETFGTVKASDAGVVSRSEDYVSPAVDRVRAWDDVKSTEGFEERVKERTNEY